MAEAEKYEIKRIKTYIEGLDENMQGGIPDGHIVLVRGSAGTMKSSLCFNILYNECISGKNGLYISLEQSTKSILKHIVNMRFDMGKVNLVEITDIAKLSAQLTDVKKSNKGNLVMCDIGAIRKQVKGMELGPSADWLNTIKNIVKKMKESGELALFVLDSLSALYVLSKFDNPRASLFHIFEYLRDLEVTTLIISETRPKRADAGDSVSHGQFDVEDFLADGIILLELAERQRKVTRELSVVKMRATNTNIDVWTLEFKNGKFKVLYGGQPPLL
ncbi:hypothetical protein JXA85_01985 [Candidatus Woesearchaeota archaeon]|nr:hypothetical protein [Candidatus Woesearchaeota archaeon]